MSRLITTSLISGIDWFTSCPPSWKRKAYQDLYNQLSRIWSDPSPAIKRGMDFEKHVYATLSKPDVNINKLNCSSLYKKVLKLCKGGVFGSKNKNFILVDNKEYCLYGKEDVVFEDKIIDIKTTINFRPKKYEKSFQHKIYLYNSGKLKFQYIVVVFEDEVSNKIKSVETIDINITKQDLSAYEIMIKEKTREIEQFFNSNPEFKELYENKFCLY
jgi:hypothetical protein